LHGKSAKPTGDRDFAPLLLIAALGGRCAKEGEMIEGGRSKEAQDLLLLHRVAERISSILDLPILLEQIVSDVAQTFGYCRSAVLLRDEVTGELVITHGWTGEQKKIGDRFQIGKLGIAGYVGKTLQTHYAADVSVDPYYEIGHPSTRSEVDIPLVVRGELIGIFNMQH